MEMFSFAYQIFADCIVRDSELVCVELIASDKYGDFCGTLFLGSIRYDALKRVYDARVSNARGAPILKWDATHSVWRLELIG